MVSKRTDVPRAAHYAVPHPNELPVAPRLSALDNSLVNVHARILGSIKFIYFCYVLEVIALYFLVQQTTQTLQAHGALAGLVGIWTIFIAQTFIQLIALPVLQNYQNRQTTADEAKADADHAALTYIAQLQDTQLDILTELRKKQ